MPRQPRPETGIDLTSIEHAMTEAHDEPGVTIQCAFKQGIVDTPGGLFILNVEGVGAGPLADADEIEFNGYAHSGRTTSMTPVGSWTTTAAEVRKLATGTRINLAEFVRVFGHRLDSNYRILAREIRLAGGPE